MSDAPPQHRNALPPGFLLQEYRIESVLGNGGFGITYLAKDTNLEQWVAIKEYLPNSLAVRERVSTVFAKCTADEEAFHWGLQRFLQEARTLAHFHHPNIVRVLRFFEANGTAYMVMEYHEGDSLSARLKLGTLEEAELLKIILPIMDGLQQIHEAGFLHRDIKPANIFIRRDGVPVLLDFGSARYAMTEKSTDLTSIVTPGYAPFEQYDRKAAQGPWTDIYALGAVMYYAISGSPPREAIGRMKQDDLLRAVDIGAGKYRHELLTAIDWALALDENYRPRSIAEWRDALIAKPLELFPGGQARPAPAFPAGLAVLAAILLLSALAGGVAMYQRSGQPAEPKPSGTVSAPLKQQVNRFVESYFAAIEKADVEQLISHYAEEAVYYNLGKVPKDAIRKDKTGFFKRWPEVKYTLVGIPEIQDTANVNEKLVEFVLDFNAHNPAENADAAYSIGRAHQTWRLRIEPGSVKIVSENQIILKRQRQNE